MTPKVVCSICSRAKREDSGRLPARERYIGSHIGLVEEIAKEKNLPFFILSGVFGFISGNEPIENYDHLLVKEEVEELSSKVRSQLEHYGVKEVYFYTKDKPNWQPYLHALQAATARSGATLEVELLPAD